MSHIARQRPAFRRVFALHPVQRRFMSVRPQAADPNEAPARKKVTIQTLNSLKASRTPISMMTAYDYPTAMAVSSTPLSDMILVGDSLSQVCLGYSSTTEITMDEMIHHSRAAARGTTHPFLLVDMPFGSYATSVSDAIANAVRLVKEGRAEGLKIEGGHEILDVVRRITQHGIPVMAHIGLQPQRHHALSGYKVQGRTADGAQRLFSEALALQEAGAFAMLIEAVPQELGTYITEQLKIPTIGIGAGPGTDGQVLVMDDAMGTWSGHKAKFVRRFASLKEHRNNGIRAYCEAVKSRTFPDPVSESYSMGEQEWKKFLLHEEHKTRN